MKSLGRRTLTTLLSAVLTVFMLSSVTTPVFYSSDVEARGGGGGGFRGGGGFSSGGRSGGSSFGGWGGGKSSSASSYRSSPNVSHNVSSNSKGSTKFTSTPNSQSFKTGTVAGSRGFAATSITSQRTQAKTALTESRARFKTQPATKADTSSYSSRYSSNPTYSGARSADSTTYYDRRSSYYGSQGWNSPPAYVYGGSPSFGMWDTIFLYSILNNNANAGQFAHNHENDADYRAWRKEADKLATDNAQLRDQLAAMDKGAADLKGTPVDPAALPKGVDPDIALSQDALTSVKPALRVCVGTTSGAYHKIATRVLGPGLTTVNVTTVATSGTPEILAKLVDGTCDAGFAQNDGYWNYIEEHKLTETQAENLPFTRISSPYKEAIHMVCHQDSGIRTIQNLTSDNKVWFPKNSGGAVTWTNIIAEDDDYTAIQTPLNTATMAVATNEEALLKVSDDANSCSLFVAAPGISEFEHVAESVADSKKLVLINVSDSNLNDAEDPAGVDVYEFGTLTTDQYPNLLRQAGFRGWWPSSVETPFLNTDFLVSNKWKADHEKIYPNFVLDFSSIEQDIHVAVHQE